MIQLVDVHKSYTKEHETIKGVSFEVHEGQIFGLLGPNGAGKTTLMQMIATLMKPTSGQILIDGLSAESLSAMHISQDEFFQKVIASAMLSNELYIVSSDYINAYEEQIKNLEEEKKSFLDLLWIRT